MYNHMFSIAFTVLSEEPDGSDVTPEQIREGIKRRMILLQDSEVLEAVGYPDDSYEMDAEDIAFWKKRR